MKNAFLLTGLLMCASGIYAEEKSVDTIADGKKRNEEAYEQMLEQTGWKDPAAPPVEKNNSQQTHQDTNRSSRATNG